eukprot:2120686-Pleurochrysis_carterae.AAC.1
MFSRSRTGGGPPSGTLAAKKRDTENVEQGGEATTAAYTPDAHRSSNREYTESRSRSWCSPPPCSGWLSIISTDNPACFRNVAMPSGR